MPTAAVLQPARNGPIRRQRSAPAGSLEAACAAIEATATTMPTRVRRTAGWAMGASGWRKEKNSTPNVRHRRIRPKPRGWQRLPPMTFVPSVNGRRGVNLGDGVLCRLLHIPIHSEFSSRFRFELEGICHADPQGLVDRTGCFPLRFRAGDDGRRTGFEKCDCARRNGKPAGDHLAAPVRQDDHRRLRRRGGCGADLQASRRVPLRRNAAGHDHGAGV